MFANALVHKILVQEFKPTPDQEHILMTDKSAVVKAGPGTGKTRTAIEKARRYIAKLTHESSEEILFLSFSNAAIYRLASAAKIRFSKKEKSRVRFMTYHSFAAEILRMYGRFVGLPPKIHIMDTLEQKLVSLEEEWSDSGSNLSQKLLEIARSRGFLAFETLIPLTVRLLSCSQCLRNIIARRYPLILVDEFQDTSEDQWRLLQLLGESSQVIAFADPNQIIYSSLHNVSVERMDEFASWKGITPSVFSGTGFRFQRGEILKFAESLLNATPYYQTNDSGVNLYELKYRTELRSKLALIWLEIHSQLKTDETLAFLTPSNLLAEEVAVHLRNPPPSASVSFPVFVYLARDEAAYDALILALAAFRDYAITGDETTCRKAAMALLAMNVAWNGRKKLSLSKLNSIISILQRCKAGDGSELSGLMNDFFIPSHLNKFLVPFIKALACLQEFDSSCKRLVVHVFSGFDLAILSDPQLLLFDSLRANRRPKGLYGYDAGHSTTQVFNYHKAKGREFDYVVMIVDPRQESNKTPIEENRRLYYVCATRAKKWLGVIYYHNEFGRVLGPILAPA
jgi:superfamily I DNA/RNA helicase